MGKKSKFELSVIDRIRQLRIQRNLSQDDLAAFLNTSRGFIGQVESPNSPSKYNLNHINKLAQELDCSPKDFFPDRFVAETNRSRRK